EQLESVHVSRQRAQAAHDLFHHYNQLSRGDTSSLEALKKEGKNREGTRQVAIILRRLNVVAKEVDVPGADVTREHIDKYCEKFEKDMLKLFDRYYRKGDPKMMARCAQTLLEFNGGSSCVQMYVNQHDFFISENRTQQPDDTNPLWQTLADPYASAPKKEPGLSAMFAQIRATVEQEAQIIQAVFPNPPIVMQVFLQRVFAQVIQQHLETILQKSSTMSNLAFLRMLSMAHLQTTALVEDLKQYDLSATVMRSTMTAVAADPLAVGGTVATGTAAPFGPMLDTAMEEMFVSHTEGTKYLERESKSLGEMYLNLLLRFTKYHEKASKSKTSNLYGRLVNQLATAAVTSSSNSAPGSTRAQAAAAFIKFSGISAQNESEGDNPIKEEDGMPSVEVAERMLKWHAEAIGRCVEMGPASEVPKHALALLRVLAEALGRSYMEVAIETYGNLSYFPAQTLKSYVTESYLGRIDAQLLRPYLAQRSDWNEFERGYDGEEPAAGTAEVSGNGLRERLGVSGRLAAVVRELDGLRTGDESGNGGSSSQRNSAVFGLPTSMSFSSGGILARFCEGVAMSSSPQNRSSQSSKTSNEGNTCPPMLTSSSSSFDDSPLVSPFSAYFSCSSGSPPSKQPALSDEPHVSYDEHPEAWWSRRVSVDSSGSAANPLDFRPHSLLKLPPPSNLLGAARGEYANSRSEGLPTRSVDQENKSISPQQSVEEVASVPPTSTQASAPTNAPDEPSQAENQLIRSLELLPPSSNSCLAEGPSLDVNVIPPSPEEMYRNSTRRSSFPAFTRAVQPQDHVVDSYVCLNNSSRPQSSMLAHCDQHSLFPPSETLAQTHPGRLTLRGAGVPHGSSKALAPSMPLENVPSKDLRKQASQFFQRLVRRTFARSQATVPQPAAPP
ncbi:Exocyst complex component 5, partial [Ceratobasidium sp. 395]